MAENIIELPPLYYFECGNGFSGSHGNMAFNIAVKEEITVSIWQGRLCFAKAEILETKQFGKSDEDYRAMREYLDSCVKKLG